MKVFTQAVCLIALALASLVGCAQQKAQLTTGSDNSNIIGGSELASDADIAKSTVAIYDKARGALCTASIISEDMLLTAAHCVKDGNPADYRVLFTTDVFSSDKIVKKVVDMKYNQKWDQANEADVSARDLGDIAVIRFEGGLPDGYKPAKLLSRKTLIKDGSKVTLAGYGNDDGSNQSGSGKLRSVEVEVQDSKFATGEVEIDQSGGKGACHGDSGGPAYIAEGNGDLVLFGITSRGENDPHNTCGVSSVYTDAAAYKPWIRAAITQLGGKAPPTARSSSKKSSAKMAQK